jgi:hypothetical protein
MSNNKEDQLVQVLASRWIITLDGGGNLNILKTHKE